MSRLYFACAVFCIYLAGCGATNPVAISNEYPPNGEFYEQSNNSMRRVGPESVVLSATFSLYLSTDDCRNWKCIYSVPKTPEFIRSLDQCVGGTSSRMFFVLNKENHGENAGHELMSWSAADGACVVGDLPGASECRFVNEKAGVYAYGMHLFTTQDGGKNWKEFGRLPMSDPSKTPPEPEFNSNQSPNGESINALEWISPTRFAIASSAGLVAVYELDSDNVCHLIWKRIVVGSNGLVAVSQNEIWVSGFYPELVRLKAMDGSIILRAPRVPRGLTVLITDHRAYSTAASGVLVFEVNDEEVNRIATIPIRYPQAFVMNTHNHLVFTADEGHLYEWDGTSENARELKPRIDNAVVRAANAPPPGSPTRQERDEYAEWGLKAGPKVSTEILHQAEAQKDWTQQEQVRWVTAQCKLSVAHHGAWSPPKVMPAHGEIP